MDVMDELIDRFGDPPPSVQGLVDVALLRNMASSLGIKEISQKESQVILYPEVFDLALAGSAASKLKGRILVNAGIKPYIAVKIGKGDDSIEILREVLSAMDQPDRAEPGFKSEPG